MASKNTGFHQSDAELIARLRELDGWVMLGAHTHLAAANRIEALTEQLAAARQDAKAAEVYAEELEDKLSICEKYRDAYAECDRIGTQAVRDLEVKLEKAVEALKCWNSMMQNEAYDLGEMVCEFDLIARATIAEIKLQSSEFATQKGESHE